MIEAPFFWQRTFKVATHHIEIFETQTNPSRFLENLNVTLRSLQRFFNAAFDGGIVVTLPVRTREVEVEHRVGRLFTGCQFKQADAFLVILLLPDFASFLAESFYLLVWFVCVWLAHVLKGFLILGGGKENVYQIFMISSKTDASWNCSYGVFSKSNFESQ